MCNSNSTQGCGFAFLYHMAVFHLRNCMEFLTRPLSNEKVVRPALIYSLFPNVPPTIYFGTPDERGKPGRVSTWNSPQEKVASEAGGRVEGAFQNVCIGAWLPTWSTSPMKESLSCPSFSWPSWPHNLMCHSWPLTLCLSPFHPPLLSAFLIPVQSPFFPKVCSETLTWNNTDWLAYRECWATVPPLSSPHHDSPALLHTLPLPSTRFAQWRNFPGSRGSCSGGRWAQLPPTLSSRPLDVPTSRSARVSHLPYFKPVLCPSR